MKFTIKLTGIIGVLLLAGCTTGAASLVSTAVPVGAVYGATATVANPPNDLDDVKATAAKVGASIQATAAEAQGHMENFGGAAKDGFYQVTDHVADWMRPTVPKPPQPIAASYCYRVYQDILCYRRPMPGWENRLAGYQPLTADPPQPSMMQPLPVRALDNSRIPANRVAGSKPVFTEMPAQADAAKPAEDPATPTAAAASDATHEQLPDPALAPQL